MRSLWLASAALCLTAGVAMAQTASSSPAPTGAPNAAAASPAPGASPGNMAPSSGKSGSGSAMTTGSATSTMPAGRASMSSPGMATNMPPQATTATGGLTSGAPSTAANSAHYNGQNSISPAAGQASSEGNSGGDTTNGMSGTKPLPTQHVASAPTYSAGSSDSAMSLPENADPSAYLKIASKAIKQHDKMLADDALSDAETRMLTRAVPASEGATADDSPGVTAIEHARQALASGDYQTAASDTRMAMHAHHGMMGAEGMNGSGMGGGSDMPMAGAGASGGPTQ